MTPSGAVHDHLLPGVGAADSAGDDAALAERLRHLSFTPVTGSADPGRHAAARIDACAPGSALPEASTVALQPADAGWLLRLGRGLDLAVGHGAWRESTPLGRPVVAAGAWQGETFVAELFVITSPHRVHLVLDTASGTATARWSTVPLTSADLELHLTHPLMTRSDVA